MLILLYLFRLWGFCRKVGFFEQNRKTGTINSMTYRIPNSSKTNFATEPTPSPEVLGIAPHYRLGLPTCWVDDFDIDYYNGRAKDVDGKRIVTNYHEGDFIAERFDPDDPPSFESQAAYLRGLKLFAPGEARRVRKSQYAPETINWGPLDDDK